MDYGIRDIHNYPRKLARAIRHILSNNTVSNKNKLAILRFVSFVGVTEGRSLARQAFYAQHLERLAELLGKDFVDANEDDIHAVVAKVNTMTVRSFKNNGAETTILKISDWTKEGYKITLKKFYRRLRKKHRGQCVETGWIQVKKIRSKIKASDLLSPHEVKGTTRLISCPGYGHLEYS